MAEKKEKQYVSNNAQLMAEWDYEKNTKLKPETLLLNSNKKVWWKCEHGHSWEAAIAHRTRGRKCPVCQSKKILSGYNDLATTHPQLIQEWDYEKNVNVTPNELGKGSEKKVWWRCNRGHSWSAAVYSRASGVGCPHCAKELQSSFPEKAVYFYIKRVFPDAIANYHPNLINTLELDVFIPTLQIGIEYDGERWHQKIEKDLHKNKLCAEAGISLIRIREPACPALLDELSICVVRENKKTGLDKTIKLLFEEICKIASIECAIDIDLERDHIAILELLNPIEKENSISQLAPHLINEWAYQENGDLLPNMVTVGSDKKVWWICPKGHSYIASAVSRVSGKGCPVCSGKKVLKGVNDFPTYFPELLEGWDYEKNTVSPFSVAYGSDKKYWWKCKLGHSYEQSINNRRVRQSCSICSNKKILVGFNDIVTTHPLIAEEWDQEHNSIKPSEVTAGSHQKILWKCRTCGNKWEAPVYNRTSGHGCPYCSGRRIVKRTNDLETVNPCLAQDWNYEKNNGLLPSDFTANSGKTVWWKCKEGHEWQAKICNRNNGRGCPFCAGKKVLPGYNDLQTKKPILAEDWNYEKNSGLLPSEVSPNSGKTVWWKCKEGHEWQARIDSRSKGNGCPQCAREKRKRNKKVL